MVRVAQMDRARKNTSHRLVAWRHKLRYQIRWSGFLHWKNCLQQFGSTLASEASSGPKPLVALLPGIT